jgi:ubiquinone/menaquinone biosynthesis C-methylase UbiE
LNKEAWSTKAYEVWKRLYGEPQALAHEMKENTDYYLRRVLIHTGEVKRKRIINLCGSNGRRAVPLALKGADVTVVDISEENMQYAIEVSKEAGVNIRYIVADVMQLPSEVKLDQFDFVLMEFGILHYFAVYMNYLNLTACEKGLIRLRNLNHF